MRELLAQLTEVAVPLIDIIALVIVLGGTLEAVVRALSVAFSHNNDKAREIWLRYSRWLIAGLTFQLASDIIETSVTPNWNDIGRLAAIAVIRTVLNYFLEKDIREQREIVEERTAPPSRTRTEPAE